MTPNSATRDPATVTTVPTAAPVLRAEGLTKRFGSAVAVDGLDLAIHPGEVVGLLGPNGAGKTTTVKMLLGLTRPDEGTAWIHGIDAASPAARRGVGYLPEAFAQPAWATGEEVLRHHAALAGLRRDAWAEEVTRVIHRVGLAGRGHERVGGYSKGMRQRLGLAAALIGEPGVVVLDEPTSAMDPIGRKEVRDMVADLGRAGTAVLLNSHLLGEVEQMCDRVVVMDRGRVLTDRPVDHLPGGGEVRLTVDAVDADLLALVGGFGAVGHHDARTVLVTLDDADAAPEMVVALAAAGARVRAMVPLQSSLEELFLQLVHDRHPHDPAAGGRR